MTEPRPPAQRIGRQHCRVFYGVSYTTTSVLLLAQAFRDAGYLAAVIVDAEREPRYLRVIDIEQAALGVADDRLMSHPVRMEIRRLPSHFAIGGITATARDARTIEQFLDAVERGALSQELRHRMHILPRLAYFNH